MKGWGRGTRRVLARSAAPALLAAVSLACAALPAQAKALAVAATEAKRAAAFWTPARMRQARPLETTGRSGAKIVPGGPVATGAAAQVRPFAPPSWGATASAEFEAVPDPTDPLLRQNGAIFIETPFGFARCSGTSVNAPNYSVVFTAGHCVNTGGRSGSWLSDSWVFVPGYRYGQRPFGIFPAKWIETTRQWRATGSENFDVGAAVVTRNERGQLLAKAVGGSGVAWGLKARQVFDVHGYPVAPPFDGETQRLCAGTPFLGHDAGSFLWSGPLNLAVDCDVTGGASGGGWTIRHDVLNGVTDYGYGDDPHTDFSAYFGTEVARLFHRAARVR